MNPAENPRSDLYFRNIVFETAKNKIGSVFRVEWLKMSFGCISAEQLEMYKEMKETMKQLVETKSKEGAQSVQGLLSEDERNLLSVAYKNVVGQRRTSWRIVCSLESKTDDEWKHKICKEFREQIEGELKELCNEIITLLEDHLLPKEGEIPEQEPLMETAVFFFKMKGDYLRLASLLIHNPLHRKTTV